MPKATCAPLGFFIFFIFILGILINFSAFILFFKPPIIIIALFNPSKILFPLKIPSSLRKHYYYFVLF
jgi:hypothetical protein